MCAFPEAICPLCSQFYARDQLQLHIAAEDVRRRQMTIEVIQAYHKGWSKEQGACEACWKSFRDAGSILSVLKQTTPQHPRHVL
jgi:hypothetical protein